MEIQMWRDLLKVIIYKFLIGSTLVNALPQAKLTTIQMWIKFERIIDVDELIMSRIRSRMFTLNLLLGYCQKKRKIIINQLKDCYQCSKNKYMYGQ